MLGRLAMWLCADAGSDRVRQRVAVGPRSGVARDRDRQVLNAACIGGEVPLSGTGIDRCVLNRDRRRPNGQRAGDRHWMSAGAAGLLGSLVEVVGVNASQVLPRLPAIDVPPIDGAPAETLTL